MINLPEDLTDGEKSKARKSSQPNTLKPMLAVISEERFSHINWIFERKLDGERCLAFRKGKSVRIMSRNGKKLNGTYPEIVDALLKLDPDDFIIDGEIVAFDGKITSFTRLQNRMHIEDSAEARKSGVRVYYYLFDMIHINGFDISGLQLKNRKSILKQAFSFKDPLRWLPHRNEKGEAFYREACKKGWEGVIAKRSDSKYIQSRSRKWLKFKCVAEQEFVVGGYTKPRGERIGFGALLVGYYKDEKLMYAGKVGTGYDTTTLKKLGKRLKSLHQKTSPFSVDVNENDAKWVRPKMVVQIGFTEWTKDGKLRHPRYLGLRRDKKPKKVIQERTEQT